MASVVAGRDPICAMICEALGLKAERTRSVQINMRSDSIVTVTAEVYPDKRQMEILEILLEEYKLVSKEEQFGEGGQNERDSVEEATETGSERVS